MAQTTVTPPAAEGTRPHGSTPVCVLVLSGDAGFRQRCREVLRGTGMEIEFSQTAPPAATLGRRNQVVIVDAGSDPGRNLLRRLGAAGAGARLLVAGDTRAEDSEDGWDGPAAPRIPTHFTPYELLLRLECVLYPDSANPFQIPVRE